MSNVAVAERQTLAPREEELPRTAASSGAIAGVTPHLARVLFAGLLVVYTLAWVVAVVRSSFVIEGQRYFVLWDDTMISMRFAYNLVHGQGLVWNPGEWVQGY